MERGTSDGFDAANDTNRTKPLRRPNSGSYLLTSRFLSYVIIK